MIRFAFKKLDAFASGQSTGNPAAVIQLTSFDEITPDQMQRIARELKGCVCEAAFMAPIAPDAYKVRYYSSEKEVQFCGHATIALAYNSVTSNPDLAALPHFYIHTNKGVLKVENHLADQDAVYVQAPSPFYTSQQISDEELCAVLGLAPESLDREIPQGTVNAGNQTLCIALRTLEDVLRCAPDYATLLAFCQKHALDVVTIYSRQTAFRDNQLRTRVFAAPFGYLEDPATGSGNAALGYHLHRTGHWDGSPLRIEQNASQEQPNLVRLASMNTHAEWRVIFGGGAQLRMEGSYCLNV